MLATEAEDMLKLLEKGHTYETILLIGNTSKYSVWTDICWAMLHAEMIQFYNTYILMPELMLRN